MLIGDFLAVGNGHACDSDHTRMPFVSTGRKTGKSLSWVEPSLSLVPRRDEYVRHGMRGMMSGDSVLLDDIYSLC